MQLQRPNRRVRVASTDPRALAHPEPRLPYLSPVFSA